jgi:hypothetical protein
MPAVAPAPKKLTSEEARKAGWIKKYGVWHPPLHDLIASDGGQIDPRETFRMEEEHYRALQSFYIEKAILQRGDPEKTGKKNPAWADYETHFKAFVSSALDRPDSTRRFTWNPNAEKILHYSVKYNILAIGGAASSSKTETTSVIGMFKWLLSPHNTKVFCTTTTMDEGRQRIWGVIEAYWNELKKLFFGREDLMPGKLVSSRAKIKAVVDGKPSDLYGINLLPGDKSADENTTKVGFKAENIILIGDEFAKLSHALFKALANLFSNPGTQVLASANPEGFFDPFGTLATPEDGWASINDESEGWKCANGGYCIRLDGLKSPNVLAGREIWKGLLTIEGLLNIKKLHGEDSPDYWRQARGYFSPSGVKNCIFSEHEIIEHGGDRKGPFNWVETPTPLAFLDPAFTFGGDHAIATFGLCGKAKIPELGNKILNLLEVTETLNLSKLLKKGEDASIQLVDLFSRACSDRHVTVRNRGIDSTGGGIPFQSLLSLKIGDGFLSVPFGGDASEMTTSHTDKRTGKERFANKVSELWYVIKDFIRGGQLKGLEPDVITELCARLYRNIGERVKIESKDDMKKRIQKSPDRADSLAGLVFVARTRLGYSPGESSLRVPKLKREQDPWANLRPNRNMRIINKFANLGWD